VKTLSSTRPYGQLPFVEGADHDGELNETSQRGYEEGLFESQTEDDGEDDYRLGRGFEGGVRGDTIDEDEC